MSSKRLRRGEKVLLPAERLALVLESTQRSVELADRIIRRFSVKAGCNEQQQSEISLAVREVVANAVFHGNEGSADKKVTLIIESRDKGIMICVQDEGPGFDPASLPDPRDPANLLLDHGRGVFLVNATMDEVKMRRRDSCGMEVTMIKYF